VTRGLGRALAVPIGALLLVAGLGAVAWRVLRPSATFDRAGTGYPVRPAATAAWSGSLQHAPLILDGRLRVYAEARRVWADATPTGRYETSPYWSYRRWPAQVVGVVTVERPVPYVLVRWSDGVVTGIDARAGRIGWQRRIAPADRHGYAGRRTGARTMYDPPGLHTAAGPDDRPVLVVAGDRTAAGYDPHTGRRLWTRSIGCPDATGWTGTTTYVIRCGDRLDIVGAATGRPVATWTGHSPQPCGCALGHSGCQMITTGDGTTARLAADGTPTPVPAADAGTDRTVAGGYVEWRADSYLGVVDADTGAYRWQRPLRGTVLATDAARLYLLAPGYRLITLDATTGAEVSTVQLGFGRRWWPGYVYVHDGFVVLERVVGSPRSNDDGYYYSAQGSVLLAGTNPAPPPPRPGTGRSLRGYRR
jgi:outer membrane protein assembly factor BamB